MGRFAPPRRFDHQGLKCYTARMKAHVWVMPKRTVLDPQGQTIHQALSGLGYEAVKDVRQGKFFVLNLDGWTRDEAQEQVERISKEVLTNPVIEEYRFEIVE
jgi:phosphoribosylformylglycinamidine synthase subunit PurS